MIVFLKRGVFSKSGKLVLLPKGSHGTQKGVSFASALLQKMISAWKEREETSTLCSEVLVACDLLSRALTLNLCSICRVIKSELATSGTIASSSLFPLVSHHYIIIIILVSHDITS